MHYPSSFFSVRRVIGWVLIGVLPVITAARADAAEPVRLLTIGNSFAHDATLMLPDIAKAGGKELVLVKANISGASLRSHVSNMRAAERGEPAGYAYNPKIKDPETGAERKSSLQELLQSQPWDIVTIQQVSTLSYKPETYQPSADNLVEAIRRLAPKAEVVVHETWAYREDAPLFKEATLFSRQRMHERLAAAYRGLADSRGLRILPVGDAFELARGSARWTYQTDPDYDFKNPKPGTLPDQKSSLNVGWRSGKGKDGKPALWLDFKHANTAGKYLGACVWYLVLFNEDVIPTGHLPGNLSSEDAADLRTHALEAVRAERARVQANRPLIAQ